MNKKPTHTGRDELDWVSPELISSLRELVSVERDMTLSSMPTDRVMRAVRRAAMSRSSAEDWLSIELLSWFRPVFAVGVLIVALLAAYNFQVSKDSDLNPTTTERVLGLHPVTVVAAYDLEFDGH